MCGRVRPCLHGCVRFVALRVLFCEYVWAELGHKRSAWAVSFSLPISLEAVQSKDTKPRNLSMLGANRLCEPETCFCVAFILCLFGACYALWLSVCAVLCCVALCCVALCGVALCGAVGCEV